MGLALALAWLIPVASLAADVEGRLAEVEPEVDAISDRAELLHLQAGPDRSYASNAYAVTRFQDLLYLHMIGEFEAAAEGFFALVVSGALADHGLHRDAEWYLADSLFELANYDTAESQFLVAANDPAHPFRGDAVRRLLEIYAVSGQAEKFDALYQAEIVSGRVKASDLIVFSVGRSFWRQRDRHQAATHFGQIPLESPFYGRARYYLGTIAVVEGALDEALALFEQVRDVSIDSTIDRQVHDLAVLAVARIHYERADYRQAREWYERISADSDYQAERLYELVWTDIRRATLATERRVASEAFQSALAGIEIFLLGYDDHEDAARLRVAQGKLHMAETQYDDALDAFQSVVAEYDPIRERLARVANDDLEGSQTFEEMVRMRRAGETGPAAGLPAYAVAMVQADPDLGRAMDLVNELESQERSIEVSESLIEELNVALGGDSSISGFVQMRHDALELGQRAVETQLLLVGIEIEALRDAGIDGGRLDGLERRRVELTRAAHAARERSQRQRTALEAFDASLVRARQQGELQRAPTLDDEARAQRLEEMQHTSGVDPERLAAAVGALAALLKELDATRAELDGGPARTAGAAIFAMTRTEAALVEDVEALRVEVAASWPDGDGLGRRFDAAQRDLAASQGRLRGVHGELTRLEDSELARIVARFDREVDEVASERLDLSGLYDDSDGVAMHLAQVGFGRIEDFFDGAVMDADLGIVDVFWAERLAVRDEITRLKEERTEVLDRLEERFELIRDKLSR